MRSDEPRAPRRVPLSAISRHLETQVRGSTDAALAHRYAMAMKAGEVFPPLGVADLGGALILYDGFHRAAASEIAGVDEVDIVVCQCVSLDEVRWLGFQANLRHGQPLKRKAIREAFRTYVSAERHRVGGKPQSYRDMARAIPGTSYSAIRRWTQEDFPNLFVELGEKMPAGEGGCRDLPSPETVLWSGALAGIDEVAALMAGVECQTRRDEVADKLRSLALLLSPETHSHSSLDLSGFFPPD